MGNRHLIKARDLEAAAWRDRWESWRRKQPRLKKQTVEVSGRDVLKGLGAAFEATGDPLFRDAAVAFKAYALDCGRPSTAWARASAATFGDPLDGYLEQIKWQLNAWKKLPKHKSVLRAAQKIAADFLVPGTSFDEVTKTLRLAYAERQKAVPLVKIPQDPGYVGYRVLVKPLHGLSIRDLQSDFAQIPDDGAVVRYTNYWRRLFEEGAIAIQRQSENLSEKIE